MYFEAIVLDAYWFEIIIASWLIIPFIICCDFYNSNNDFCLLMPGSISFLLE